MASVLLAEELPCDLAHVEGVRRAPSTPPLLFNPADHARVEAESRAEGEPARWHALVLGSGGAADPAQTDRALAPLVQRVQQGAGRLHGVVRQAEGAREDIGAAARDHRETGECLRGRAV